MTPRLLQKYKDDIIPALNEKFGYKNPLEAPVIKKIVLNMGVGAASQDIAILENAMKDLAFITGQKPLMTRAKKSIANFKIRKDMPIGCKVTLRRTRMYEFLDRFINIALPRIRDFQGISAASFDQNGNYSLGINDYTIFPEINIDKVSKILGMDIIINISSKSKEESFELLKMFGMPFKR